MNRKSVYFVDRMERAKSDAGSNKRTLPESPQWYMKYYIMLDSLIWWVFNWVDATVSKMRDVLTGIETAHLMTTIFIVGVDHYFSQFTNNFGLLASNGPALVIWLVVVAEAIYSGKYEYVVNSLLIATGFSMFNMTWMFTHRQSSEPFVVKDPGFWIFFIMYLVIQLSTVSEWLAYFRVRIEDEWKFQIFTGREKLVDLEYTKESKLEI